MRYLILGLLLVTAGISRAQTAGHNEMGFDQYPFYPGKDLGLTYRYDSSVFKVWSPPAEAMRLLVYAAGEGGNPLQVHEMHMDTLGVWRVAVQGNLKRRFYAFQAKHSGKWSMEVPDPYARAVGVNGMRAMVLDLGETNPENWDFDRRPVLAGFNDILLYELHVRDFSSHPSSRSNYPGQYLAFTERGLRNPERQRIGMDHLRSLGVTHIHLLPVFDFRSVDERLPRDSTGFNWGYDPQNYNVPEGSYSSNPYDGAVRIREFKMMVKAMHEAGLRVVMDVVYNHTGFTETSLFNQLVPGYYYRQDAAGGFSNASACGNETASERAMVRKFIVESAEYWAREYHIDGFRFDLMGIHDIETMNAVRKALDRIDPTIFIYGEGWTASGSPLPEDQRALKKNTSQLDRIAAFSDDFRDGLRGHVFTPTDKGFASGAAGLKESVKFGVAGAVFHPQVDYGKVNYSRAPWAKSPAQCINYVSCHDNHTLWDRLALSAPEQPESLRARMQRLALTMVLTAQGVPFLHAGSEMMRTKQGAENSFDLPDSINQINWGWRAQHAETFDYIQALIQIRKAHPAFRMPDAAMIRKHLTFVDLKSENVLAYLISDNANGDKWKSIMVIYNGSAENQGVPLPPVKWTMALNVDAAHPEGFGEVFAYNLIVPPFSAVILFSDEAATWQRQ
ncbi:MAG: type I pullulanase [Saprospiraceae bacterium]|jgi:pullulanase